MKLVLKLTILICLLVGNMIMGCSALTPNDDELKKAEDRAVFILSSSKFCVPEILEKDYIADTNEYIIKLKTQFGELYTATVDMSSKDENGDYNKITIDDTALLEPNVEIDELAEAINSRNAERIKSLFSKQAIEEAGNPDNSIEGVLELINSDITSWKYEGKSMQLAADSNDERIVELAKRYDIILETGDKYMVTIAEKLKEKEDSYSDGIYMLKFETADNQEPISDSDEWSAGIVMQLDILGEE